MGELAGGGSVPVAVGVSDRGQVTHDTQHTTNCGIGATIRTRREIQRLLCAGFVLP